MFSTDKMLEWIGTRLSERSTWLGIITIMAAWGVNLAPGQELMIVTAGASIAGAIMVFTKDHNIVEAIETAVADAMSAQNNAAAANGNVSASSAPQEK